MTLPALGWAHHDPNHVRNISSVSPSNHVKAGQTFTLTMGTAFLPFPAPAGKTSGDPCTVIIKIGTTTVPCVGWTIVGGQLEQVKGRLSPIRAVTGNVYLYVSPHSTP